MALAINCLKKKRGMASYCSFYIIEAKISLHVVKFAANVCAVGTSSHELEIHEQMEVTNVE